MIEPQHRVPTNAVLCFANGPTNTNAPTPMSGCQQAAQSMQVDDDDCCENFRSPPVASKRKSSSMRESRPPSSPPTQTAQRRVNKSPTAAPGPKYASGGEEITKQVKTPLASNNRQRQQVSMDIGEVMGVPLAGKTVPFRVVKRRGKGFNSVVFECHEEREEAMEDGADHPRVVTVKVMSGGESGMGACLHEVETLAFLKVKRQEAGLTHERSRFAELASWFYRRSAAGGVDHVCLVFRGGGLSLREAMSARSPLLGAGGVGSGRTAGGPPSSPPQLAWGTQEVVEVARGLLEGIAFLHSVGLIHADIKPDNVALYPPSSPSPLSSAIPATATPTTPEAAATVAAEAAAAAATEPSNQAPFDLRLIDLGNAVFAADTVPGVTAGTPSFLSPEASRGLAWGPPVDVWAAGCVLYEITTGGRVAAGILGVTVSSGNAYNGVRAGDVESGNVGGFGSGGVAAGGSVFGSRPGVAGAGSGQESDVTAGLVGLVESLLLEDVTKRPSAEEALKCVVFSSRN